MKFLIALLVLLPQYSNAACHLVLTEEDQPWQLARYQVPNLGYKVPNNALAISGNNIAISNANKHEIVLLELKQVNGGIHLEQKAILHIPATMATSSPAIQINSKLNQIVYASGALHHFSVARFEISTAKLISAENFPTGYDLSSVARAISPDLNTLVLVPSGGTLDPVAATNFPKPTVVYLNDPNMNFQLPVPSLSTMLFDYMAFSPDSKLLTGIQSGIIEPHHKLITWNLNRHLEIMALYSSPHVIRTPGFSPDGNFLMVGDLHLQQIRIWDVLKFFKEKGGTGIFKEKNNHGGFMNPALSPKRDLLAFASDKMAFGGDAQSTLFIYKMDPKKMRPIGKTLRFNVPELVNSIAFTEDGEYLIVLNDKGALAIVGTQLLLEHSPE